MMATIGAAAKVDTNDTKKPIHDMWKDAWCGWLKEKMFRLFALCSLSTSMVNVGSTGAALMVSRLSTTSVFEAGCAGKGDGVG
jgi:hypothetical protein